MEAKSSPAGSSMNARKQSGTRFSRTPGLLGAWLCAAALLIGSTSEGWAADHQVTVSDFVFTPSSVNAAAGDTITWVWVNGTHTTASLNIPQGARQWNKPIDVDHPRFRMPVTIVGRYRYGDRFNQAQGMLGQIFVSGSPTPSPTATATATATFTPTPTPEQSPTPTATATFSPTATATATATFTPTATATAT